MRRRALLGMLGLSALVGKAASLDPWKAVERMPLKDLGTPMGVGLKHALSDDEKVYILTITDGTHPVYYDVKTGRRMYREEPVRGKA